MEKSTNLGINGNDIDVVLFDLDGTLIDNFYAIYRCYSDISYDMGLIPKSFEELKQAVGGSISLTLSRLIGNELTDEGVERFHKHFPEVMFEKVFILPGAEELLIRLKKSDKKIGVWTNKGYDPTIKLLEKLNLTKYLDFIFGTNHKDIPWRKPQKEFSEYVLKTIQTPANRTLMVGDSPYDIQAAIAGNIPIASVTTGTHEYEPLAKISPNNKLIFKNLEDLGRAIFSFYA